MGLFFLVIGLTALLVVLIQRAAGMAMMGSLLAVGLAFVVGVWLRHTYIAETLGLLYLVAAVAVWVATPPPEELSEPLSDSGGQQWLLRLSELRENRKRAPLVAVDPPDSDSLGLVDHFLLALWPAIGFGVCALGLSRATALVDGVWGSMVLGHPGVGLAASATDVSALFGLLWVFPGRMVLALPVAGLVRVLFLLARDRSTTFAAFVEWAITAALLSGIALVAF